MTGVWPMLAGMAHGKRLSLGERVVDARLRAAAFAGMTRDGGMAVPAFAGMTAGMTWDGRLAHAGWCYSAAAGRRGSSGFAVAAGAAVAGAWPAGAAPSCSATSARY